MRNKIEKLKHMYMEVVIDALNESKGINNGNLIFIGITSFGEIIKKVTDGLFIDDNDYVFMKFIDCDNVFIEGLTTEESVRVAKNEFDEVVGENIQLFYTKDGNQEYLS